MVIGKDILNGLLEGVRHGDVLILLECVGMSGLIYLLYKYNLMNHEHQEALVFLEEAAKMINEIDAENDRLRAFQEEQIVHRNTSKNG